MAWTADPAKSKIFAKKKGETPKHGRVAQADRRRRGAGRGRAGGGHRGRSAGRRGRRPRRPRRRRRAGIPTPPEGAFLAELAKWDGAEPKLANEAAADAIVAALAGVPFVVSKVEQKDRQDRPHAAVHHEHAAAAGEHPAAVQHQPHDADRPEALRGRRAERRWARPRSSPTCGPTARGCPNDALAAVRGLHPATTALGAAVPAGEAERLRLRQERPGGPRGDPPDRRDHDPAAGRGRWASRGDQFRLYDADLAAVRRQPVRAGGARGHDRRGHRRPRAVPGHRPHREVRRLPQGARRRSASRRTSNCRR